MKLQANRRPDSHQSPMKTPARKRKDSASQSRERNYSVSINGLLNHSKQSSNSKFSQRNLNGTPLVIPFFVKNNHSSLSDRKKKREKQKCVKSFDDRLRLSPFSREKENGPNPEDAQLTSVGKNLRELGSSANQGILRHRKWKHVRRSTFSVNKNERKSQMNSSGKSKNSTLDSMGVVNRFNFPQPDQTFEQEANTGRIDQFKNPIIRGKKRHKVSFARKSRTFSVDNWKDLNLKMTIKVRKNKGCAVCKIF